LTGPFTVESLSPHRMLPAASGVASAPRDEAREDEAREDEARGADATPLAASRNYAQAILDNLRKAGVKGTDKSQRIGFERLDPFPGEYVQAEGVTASGAASAPRVPARGADAAPLAVRVSVGPEFGTVGDAWIKAAALE